MDLTAVSVRTVQKHHQSKRARVLGLVLAFLPLQPGALEDLIVFSRAPVRFECREAANDCPEWVHLAPPRF
jgi:hypothetical protein